MAEPLPLCYLNGAYLALAEARISPLDRGFLYADAVYEVMPVYAGRPFRFPAHLERLARSLAGISMEDPHTREEWHTILGRLIERNGGGDQYVYWQVTRGAQFGRTHAPLPDIPRTVFAFCAPWPAPPHDLQEKGIRCVTATVALDERAEYGAPLLAGVWILHADAGEAAGEPLGVRGEAERAPAVHRHDLVNGVGVEKAAIERGDACFGKPQVGAVEITERKRLGHATVLSGTSGPRCPRHAPTARPAVQRRALRVERARSPRRSHPPR